MERPQGDHDRSNVGMTVRIVTSYLANNRLGPHEVGPLIRQVGAVLTQIRQGPQSGLVLHEVSPPALPVDLPPQMQMRARLGHGRKRPTREEIQASIQEKELISFEDGKSYRMLKRHLTSFGLTPEAYRAKWGLPEGYPMVAPFYTRKRARLAKRTRLGHYDRETRKLLPEAPREAQASPKASTKSPEPRGSGGRRQQDRLGGVERYTATMA
ncbi:hypothetical protein LNAOJCKE_4937 [Methylorubrum aminovorans]|uniref:MucR family transcriptional regulator n=1 Tax=Methylorubrum aminovorans TaxID=269069 RepID=A0ABQ4UKB3_9HYPH|nr:MucR family transcriptional regulator [Methylorubrum aminovorans]GJE67705.1 hypothetical protein LNAOJCKE_4937 [Methylorubrum aminovorans]